MTRTNQRTRTDLAVRMTFESTRLSPVYLAEAYAVLVPVVRRPVAAGRSGSVAARGGVVRRAGGERR